MNTRPDVDVVVTAFDCTETALVETVRHVLDQSLNNLRVLAAFDGEDGRLAEALARLAGKTRASCRCRTSRMRWGSPACARPP